MSTDQTISSIQSNVRKVPRVLSIAGTDPTGGAGQQADLKTFAVLGGYGMSVVTAAIAQNTRGVRLVHSVPTEVITAQLQAVSDDVTVDAVKIGMLGSVDVIAAVNDWLQANRPPVVVLDPVMIATSGDRLLAQEAEEALRDLLHRADLVTPNLPELAVLVGEPVAEDWSTALEQGRTLAERHNVFVLVKGGHLAGDRTPDALLAPGQPEPVYQAAGAKVRTNNTHGTGCSLSSAVAVLGARTGDWSVAVGVAREWLRGALTHADELEVGQGNGPVHHGHHLEAHLVQLLTDWANGMGQEGGAGPEKGADSSFTEQLWARTGDIRSQIDDGRFVPALGQGTLPRDVFLDYLSQDLIYLQDYSRALAQLAVRAPTEQWRAFFASGAAGCARETEQLHRTLVDAGVPVTPSAVTAEYTEFLLATTQTRDWAVGAAAVLPCYWLYAWIGNRLQEHRERMAAESGDGGRDHPYGAWVDSYSDPEFTASARRARDVVDVLAGQVDPEVREEMARAFRRACELELRFFEDPCERTGTTHTGTAEGSRGERGT